MKPFLFATESPIHFVIKQRFEHSPNLTWEHIQESYPKDQIDEWIWNQIVLNSFCFRKTNRNAIQYKIEQSNPYSIHSDETTTKKKNNILCHLRDTKPIKKTCNAYGIREQN